VWVGTSGEYIFISDQNAGVVRQVIRSTGIISTLSGTTGGVLSKPMGIWGDSIGNLFVADSNSIKIIFLPTQSLSKIAGVGTQGDTGDGGNPTAATFSLATSIWGDSNGLYLFISDFNANKIRVIDRSLNLIFTAVLPATSSAIYQPNGVWGNSAGTIFFTEYNGNQARKLYSAPLYWISTVTGTGVKTSTGDGGLATLATTNLPVGVWQNSAGTIYIVEDVGSRVRSISPSGIISTICGTGSLSTYSTAANGDYGPVRLSYNNLGI
jgi:hypothetical protein